MNNSPMNDEMLQFEKFELLSAYLDGEVSAAERKQVEAWLAQDASFQKTYQQMLMLQNGLKSIPAATPSIQTEQLVQNVMARLNRSRRIWAWGSVSAAAAIALGSFSALLTGQGWDLRTAQRPVQDQPTFNTPLSPTSRTDPKALMIALERPPVEIPVVPGSNISQPQGLGRTTEF